MHRMLLSVLIAALASSTLGAQGNPRISELGFVKDGRYHHIRTGVEFPVPLGWSVISTGPSSGGGEQMYLRNVAAPQTYVAVWMKNEANTPADAEAWLQLAPKMKTDQRIGQNVQQFTFRRDSIVRTSISGHNAETATADFVERGQNWVEYFAWIYTEKTRVQFDIRGMEPDASFVRAQFDQIIQLADIP